MRKSKHAVEILRRVKSFLRASITVLLITLLSVNIALPDIVAAQTNTELHRFSAQEPEALLPESRKPIEREIAGGESHAYIIALKAGEFLRLSVEQLNLDVAVVVRSPANQMILEIDNVLTTTEIVGIVAELPGSYGVEVRAKGDEVKVGRYTLKVEAIRTPLETDHTLVAAMKAYREASTLRRQKTAKTIRQAINLYKEALQEFQKLKMAIFEVETLNYLGISYSNLGEKEDAITYYNLALAILKNAKNEYGEAAVLSNLGIAHLALGQFQKALDYFEPALKLWVKRNDIRHQAYITGRLAVINQSLGKMTAAESLFHQSLSLYEQIDQPDEKAGLWNDMGQFHYITGRIEEALNYYAKALPVLERLDAKNPLATVFNNLAIANNSKGEINLAIENFEKALRLKREAGDRKGEAIMLNNLGTAYKNKNAYQNALSNYLKALKIHREVKNRKDESYTLNNIGVLLSELGENKQSIQYQEKALTISRELGDKRSEVNALNSLGEAYFRLREMPKAMECFEHTLAIRRELNDKSQEATALKNIGLVKAAQGTFNEALDFYRQALKIFRKLGNRPNQANILILIGNIHLGASSMAEALDAYSESLSIARAIEDKSKEATALNRLAGIEIKRGNFDQARSLIESAIQVIESSRNTISNQQLKTAFSPTVQGYYATYIDFLMQMHKRSSSAETPAKTFEISERARARSLIELIRESNINITEGIDKDLKEREESLRKRIKDKNEIYIRLFSDKDAAGQKNSLQKDIGDLSLQYEEVLAEIRARSPQYDNLTQPQPLSLAEVQQRILDKDTLLLEYSLGEAQSYLWVVSSDSVTSFELAGRARIEEATKRFKQLMVDYQEFPNENPADIQKRQANADSQLPLVTADLSSLILEPAAHLLGNKRLVIVPDGALHSVPFAALPEPAGSNLNNAQPLIVNHEIVLLPSASVLDVIRRETQGRKMALKKVAVFADPVFDEKDPRIKLQVKSSKTAPEESIEAFETERAVRVLMDAGQGLPRLVFSREQAEAICAMIPESMSMRALGFAANRDKALEKDAAGNYRLGDYSFVHFATHGILNAEQPELSGIVLSLVDEQGNHRDGFLGLSEIFNMKLPVELVVLSACETGLGKNINGEGLIGLTRGFMYAGAKRVVASLWKVEDYSTSEFMKKFYEKMLKNKKPMRPAEALRATQIEMWKNGKKPYQWAAFLIQGEWR